MRKILALWALLVAVTNLHAQEKIINPDISYAGIPRSFILGGISVSGVESNTESNVIFQNQNEYY